MVHREDYLSIKPTEFSLDVGRILISVPYFNDPFFNRSVVILTDYDEENSAGLIVNRPLHKTVRNMVSEILLDDYLNIGGPVMGESVFVLHNFPDNKSSYKLAPGIYTGCDDLLISLMEHKAIESMRYKVFAGYSGWSKNQLLGEVMRKMWVIGAPTQDLIFNTPSSLIWETAVRNLGSEYWHWLKVPKFLDSN